MKTLFLQTPSYDGFDGGAGARYQARREIRSYWYPTWLAQLAAIVPDSKLIDAAPHGIGADEVMTEATHYDLAVLHSSTPTFASDLKNAARLKAAKPGIIRLSQPKTVTIPRTSKSVWQSQPKSRLSSN